MKIKKSPSKKLAPLPRQLSDLIKHLETDAESEIPNIVRELDGWPYARGDLFHWATVLDRFDSILERICNEYNLKEIQTKNFTAETKLVILSIIDLSRILFENLLHFMMRPAQRINNPRAIRSSFAVPQDKIIELARGWNNVPVELLRIEQEGLDVTPKMMTLNIQFYRTTYKSATENTPTEGHQVVSYLINEEDMKKDDIDIFLQLVKEYDIPKEYQFELANRIRIAKHINQSDVRRKLLGIRILAICIMSHAISEVTAQNKVFIYEPYLISQLAELISPENNVHPDIQTFVLYALDGITRHRNKLSEVLTAVNASANHGTMMQILRKTNSNDAYSQCFLDALFTFVSYLLQTQPGGQMLMSAGVIPTLVQIVGNHHYTQLKSIAKVVGLIDTIVNSFATSFSAFCNANGLDTLLNRIKMEVETCCSQAVQDESFAPHDRLSTIKAMLKFLLRMMDSSGTTDGLRNLIDSSLPQSLKMIMENPKLFGNSIFAIAINVSTTFIHNEPTSLPILQEAKLPQSFLHTISIYENPNNEVLMAAVNAFGAMCLNSQGLEMFNVEKPLPHFFDLMTSYDFLRNPMDVDSATGLGSTMDELIRHHPSLKPTVLQCVTAMIKKVLVMGSDTDGVGKSSDNSHLLQVRSDSAEPVAAVTDEEEKAEKIECLLVSYIDLVSRFLEGLFQNQSNIKEFVEEGCPEMLLNYYSLPLLPANFSVTIASDSLSYLFRMISEVSPLPTVFAIVAKVKESIRFITENMQDYNKSMLIDFVDVKQQETDKIERGNRVLRQMIELHGYVGLLSNICCSSVLSHGKNGASLVTEFLSEPKEENIIQLLGQLHRAMTWENLLLKEALPASWYAVKPISAATASSTLKKGLTSITEHPLGIYSTNTATEVSGESSSSTVDVSITNNGNANATEKAPSAKDPRMVNIKHFKLLLTEVPQLLMPIFQGLIKVSVSRRTGTALQKPQIMKLAEYMSDLLKDNITWSPITNVNAPACKYDYLTSVYTMASLLLRDERTQASLQIPVALSFERQGGIDLLLTNLQHMWTEALNLYQDKEKNADLIQRINTAIESLLNVLLHISSPKALRDSTFTATLIQKDKKAADYFEPFEWIVSVELKMVSLKQYLACPELNLFSKPVIQSLIKIFQQIMKGEGEFTSAAAATGATAAGRSGDPFGNFTAPLMTSPFTLLRPPVVAAERNIQTLVDMGFQRSSAEQALVRCNNQVTRAVEYLFSHPNEAIGNFVETLNNEYNLAVGAGSGINHASNASALLDFSSESASQSTANAELKSVRLELCDTLPASLLSLADQREDLVFDVRDLLVIIGKIEDKESTPSANNTTTTKASTRIITLLVDKIGEIRHDQSKSVLLSSRLRLLALLLREAPMQNAMQQLADRFSFLFDMLNFEKLDRDDPLPAWSATIFLVLEAFIAQADEPKKVKRTTINRLTSEQRGKLLQCCVSLLRRPKLSRDDIYAILRMIVRLTKDHESALHFVGIGGVPLLFSKPRSSLEGLQGQQAFIILILRHIVESKAILQNTMKDIITNWFTNPRPRNTDISSFVRSNAHVALREPAVFVKVTTDICRLARYDEFEINRQIKLKKQPEETKSEEELATTTTKQPSSSEVVIYYLLNEIMTESGYRTTTADGKHRSFVSMLINDLLPYNHINPSSEESRKQQGLSTWTASTLVAMSYDASASSTDMTAQQKNELIQVRKYVLESVVRSLKEAVASTETASIKYSKYIALADLCHRILNARASVGHIVPTYGSQQTSNNAKEDAAISNSKIMLDKNFVAVLTSAISDIDINYPHSKTILNAMLRPLEQLTKLAIKSDDATDTDKEDQDQDKMDLTEDSLHGLNNPDEDNEAPDLYRNSALGMFDAGSVIDEDEYNSGEYSDVFGSSADEEEDFDEDSGSDLSDMSEGDEDDEADDALIHGRGYDSDDMDEDDDNPDDIDAEAQLLVDEDDEDENGREMTWQLEDIEEEPGIVHAENVIDTGDDRDEQNHLRNLSDPYEEEDEMEALSDFDDASDNLDNESEADITDGMLLDAEDLDTPFLSTELHDDLVMEDDEFERPRSIIPNGFRRRFPNGRRSLLEGVGRSFRNPSSAQGQEDIITHPLLSNGTVTQPGGGNAARSGIREAFSRRGHGNGLGNWQDFEDIIGGSAVRMLEDLLTHAPATTQAGPLRVDVQAGPNGALRTFEFDRLPHMSGGDRNHSHATPNTAGDNDQSQESLAILHDFQPMSSGERWNQEARMMYGANLGEKALKLVNEILNILSPIAIEDDKKAQKRKAAQETAASVPAPQQDTPVVTGETSDTAVNNETATEVQATEVSAESNTAADAPAPAANSEAEPTTVIIHGLPVDISGTGIDVEFLNALPDDLREEVLNQHLRNRPAPVQPVEDDSISPEFLDALPPDIREEVLHQEAIERERRDRQSRQAPTTVPTPALAATTTTIPSIVEDIMPTPRRRPAYAEDDGKASGSAKKKSKPRRRDGAAQLVEKSQLSTLVRLLFVPQTISKSLLNRLLLNLCENSKTRGELLSYLVCVLYDGNNDLASVDNSFALLSSGKSGKTPQTKSARSNSTAGATDNVPNFIAQRCLEALTYIVSCNEQSMTYFLTESESLAGLKRIPTSKKGKNKEKVPNNWNKYPILVLMSLLDRPVFIDNISLMEQLMDLLSTMCRPFPILVKKYQEKIENKQNDPERRMPKPPTIPDYYLKLVVHVLTNGECSSKTFQYTLNAISHLSALEGAQQTIVNELVEDAKQSGTQILKDLESLLEVLDTAMLGTEISSTVLAPFSAATSFQAKLLRVLKTLDYMFSRKTSNTATESSVDKTAAESVQSNNEKRLLQIYETLDFLPLWETLGKCLSVIREKEELINVATVLLPLIESFMVVSKCTAEKGQNNYDKVATTPAVEQQMSLATTSPETFFFVFTEKHKKVLNIMVRNNPTLMSGSFALLVRNPKMLEFDNKRNYFSQQLHKRVTPRENYAMLQLNVRRQYVFEDSYHQLQGRTGEEIKNGKLAVRFYDEEGVDAGGVTREWFSVLARQMFDPNYALFITSAADKLTYQPNRDSAVNPDHLSFFKFVGRVIGKAIYDGRLLDAYFTRSFYKHILGRTVDYRDVEALDPEYYKSLVWMLENDITDIIDLTFSLETDFFGNKETVDLKPDGRNIPVTEANKHEYVALVTEQKLTTAIKDQINAFVQGFHDVIPAPLIQIFNEQELELLISGLPDIDIDDWKNNTEYQGYTSSSPPIQWFWRAVRSFDQEERAKLLQFATGTSKVPLEGFSQLQGSSGVQKFQIHKDFGGENRLPSAHTCFNQVDLPQYDSYENLRANLFKAISECSTGFAFV
ncbi:hypothetical protein INT48_002955 [Thamnidium elegans]|uniref:HECT-type E3 ubiquitin transferase n=1 Tax=Thamnidium elegans TaxID=101142 RepID=A0A8H7VXV5_9FUNG|nr:hypothetical protein INT48_002955 [Thamnidium elegans]